MNKRSRWLNFLIKLGFRSDCCGARIDPVPGWDCLICSVCERRV